MKVKILAHTPGGEKLIAAAAKLCYASSDIDTIFDGLDENKTERFINMLSDLGHESPFEHVTFTFGIEGVSRSLLAQITRHRIASFSVQSQRYVNKQNFSYIIPPAIEDNPDLKAEFESTMETIRQSYISLAEKLKEYHVARLQNEGKNPTQAAKAAEKMALEDARSVLPNACDTRIVMTMNVRSLWNFFSLRCCNRAQWEIRALAEEMLRQVKAVAPSLFSKAGPPCLRGDCPEGKMSCGKMKEVRERWKNV